MIILTGFQFFKKGIENIDTSLSRSSLPDKLEKYEWLKNQIKSNKPRVDQYIQNNLDL